MHARRGAFLLGGSVRGAVATHPKTRSTRICLKLPQATKELLEALVPLLRSPSGRPVNMEGFLRSSPQAKW
eukprot:15472215-Alexandrium_andersonii.AAC.1